MLQKPSPNPSRKRRLRSILIIPLCLGVFLLPAIIAVIRLRAPRDSGAYAVLSTQGWVGTPPKYPWRPYQWLANGDLAYLEQTSQGNPRVCYQPMDAHGPHGAVRRGPVLPLHLSPSQTVRFAPAPDEQWVAYFQRDSKQIPQTVLISADGRTTRTVPGEMFSLWLPDSRSFLTRSAKGANVLRVHHLDAPQVETIAGLSPNETPTPVSTLPSGSNFLIGGPFQHLASLGDATPNYPTMRFRSFSLSKPGMAQELWKAPVPDEMSDGIALVSPDNRHIFWITDGFQPTWTDNLPSSWRSKPRLGQERRYFLSDLHGENRHPVLLDIAMANGEDLFPEWTPDSKHLSFIKNHQLYLVPVE